MRNLGRAFVVPFVLLVTSACGGPTSPSGAANASVSVVAASAAPSSAGPVASASAIPDIPSGPAPVEADLVGEWVHFREQDEGDTQHWVPVGTAVPPSMFREWITLEKGGKAKVLCLAPNDAHQVFDGTWTVGPNARLAVDVTCFGGARPMRFTIVATSPSLLRLKASS